MAQPESSAGTRPSRFPLASVALAGLGSWLLAINLGAADAAIAGRLRQLGVAAGIGLPLQVLAFLAVGPSVLSDPRVALSNPIFVVLLGLSVLGLGVGYPIWAIWLGRRLSRPEGTARVSG